jgi:prepilin-type N-terminal cleavage/methylation domain-containing protein
VTNRLYFEVRNGAGVQNKQQGFTIIELLIVIVVIGILATITIVAYRGIQDRASDLKRTTDVASVMKAMSIWKQDNGNQFQSSGTGAGGTGSGWFSKTGGTYTSKSIKQLLIDQGVLAEGVKDPDTSTDYMVAFCTVSSDNRRVVLTRLKVPPQQTALQQVAGDGCNHQYLTDWQQDYGMNYARVSL